MIKDHIFLIGFMGAGKSTVARALVRRLGCPLVEMDEEIVKKQGMTINEIFEKYGEDRFRDIESQFILDLGNQKTSVVSCGGGVVVRPENTRYMKKSGKVVYLQASPRTVYERVKGSSNRPILNGHMNVEYIAQLMEKRRSLYEDAADFTIITDSKNAEEIAREIVDRLEEIDEA